MTTLTERIRADHIAVTAAKHLSKLPFWGLDRRNGTWWDITLSRPGAKDLKSPFYMGPGFDGRIPDARDVLACMTADAAMLDNARSYQEWLGDLGQDDGDDAEAMYRAVTAQTARLREFLGEQYNDYLWETADA